MNQTLSQQQQQNSNWKIYLGVILPLGLILVISALFLLLKLRKSKPQAGQQPENPVEGEAPLQPVQVQNWVGTYSSVDDCEV